MQTDSISIPGSDSWTRSEHCARPAASNQTATGIRCGGCRKPAGGGPASCDDTLRRHVVTGASRHMRPTARAGLASGLLVLSTAPALSQSGPSDPQVIAGASTAKVNIPEKKLTGYALATVRVGNDGAVREVLITEVTAEPGIEPQLVKVLQSARFRPAIDESGRPVESSIEMKVELRSSTGNQPKPVAAKPDPQLNDKEKARIKKMRCSDYVWEWDLLRKDAGDATATEFMPRIATTMYAAM